MSEFALKNNCFEFNHKVKHQCSCTAISTKFAPPYGCIFMDQVETEFLESWNPLVWFQYVDNVFVIWIYGQEKLRLFLENLTKCQPNINFTHEPNKEHIVFLDIKFKLLDDKISTDLSVC